jgi:hypothetical protein
MTALTVLPGQRPSRQANQRRTVGDEILTPEEEDHVQELVRIILGVDLGAVLQQDPDLGRHVMVADANGGFLPGCRPHGSCRRRARSCLEVQARLLKDVTVRQSQGGHSGFSFPTGIRYRVGGYRGHA